MIELVDIDKTFVTDGTAQYALRDVGLYITRGEAVAIVGESGSGKTTLARILLRLLEPSRGRYTFDGIDVSSLRGRQLLEWRRQVQAVFQNPLAALNPRLRLATLVTEPLEAFRPLSRIDRRRVAGELLEIVGLPPSIIDRFPHQLSGGQRQRVAIARALSSRPSVLILDEPLSALDVSVRAQILRLLVDLRTQFGTTYVYITHDLATVRLLCDRAYVLYRGLVFEYLPTDVLVDAPDNPYTRMLLASVPTPSARLTAEAMSAARGATSSDATNGCAFATRCIHAVTRCRQESPLLTVLDDGWGSRCHFAGAAKPKDSGNSVRPLDGLASAHTVDVGSSFISTRSQD